MNGEDCSGPRHQTKIVPSIYQPDDGADGTIEDKPPPDEKLPLEFQEHGSPLSVLDYTIVLKTSKSFCKVFRSS